MGRASIRTMLPLDRWAYHLGLEPRHFNGVTTSLAPARACHKAWLQYAWQDADRVGREDVAQAIADAERDIVEALGYYPLPQWVAGEVIRTPRAYDVTLRRGALQENVPGNFLSVEASLGKYISGGIEAFTDLGDSLIAWSDVDGDGYDETATVTAATTATDTSEIRVYFPGHGEDDLWEIRPLRSVSISGGIATILMDRHLLVDPDLWEAIDAAAVDGDVDANFVTQVEVYRVYNDPSQQVQLQWERVPGDCDCGATDCVQCAWTTQWGCLQGRSPRLGILTYQPGTWDADEESYASASLVVNRLPERVRLWYRAGYESSHVSRPMVDMDPMLERVITLYSVTLLDRPICNCNNVETFIDRWREDRALITYNQGSYRMSNRDLGCPWGTRAGAIWAWKQVERLALGRAAHY